MEIIRLDLTKNRGKENKNNYLHLMLDLKGEGLVATT